MAEHIDVEVNRRIADSSYDLIISIGQVVPHEVVGMANYSKNIFVGCGGSSMISQSTCSVLFTASRGSWDATAHLCERYLITHRSIS